MSSVAVFGPNIFLKKVAGILWERVNARYDIYKRLQIKFITDLLENMYELGQPKVVIRDGQHYPKAHPNSRIYAGYLRSSRHENYRRDLLSSRFFSRVAFV